MDMGISEGVKKEKRTEETFEIKITKNFLKLMSNTKPQIQEENIKQNKYQNETSKTTNKNIPSHISYSNYK